MIASETPIHFPEDGMDLEALCAAEVARAKPVCRIDLASGEMHADNTIMFCMDCLKLALTPVGARRFYLYGITEAQRAHELAQADGYSE